MVWYGMVWYGVVWYDMVWYGMVWFLSRMGYITDKCTTPFLHGDRLLSSVHARMRNNWSNLKCDLFVNHLSETNLVNIVMFRKMLTILFFTVPVYAFKCFTALIAWNAGQNIEIVEAVQKFIKRTKRFT